MSRKLPATDVAIIGLGWTGAILAEQFTRAGLDVIAIERGPWRNTSTDFPTTYVQDELRYAIRNDLFQQASQGTLTFRNNSRQSALPIRQFGSFLPGNGVGGAGVHWNGHTWRFLPSDFVLKSHLESRYGKGFIPNGLNVQDWGITFDELEPYYDRFDKLCGISGKAGHLKGQIQPGGNPFEGSRSSEYPTPPMRQTYGPTLFAQAAASLGYHPFPLPSANISQAYTNPLGVRLGPCTYCGFCERFGCGNYSKASPQTTVLPVLIRRPNFTAQTNSEVLKINLSRDGKRATGVTYIDSSGETWEQPAELVMICGFAYNCVHMMLVSGIGKPYDPVSGKGVVGRNYTYQTSSGSTLFFDDKIFNPFIGSGALGMTMDDFNGDNFDHAKVGFVGGASITTSVTGGRPIGHRPVPPGTPRWGAAWKSAVRDNYQRVLGIGSQGSSYPVRDAYLDLDPTYKDPHGRPLLRMTFDFNANDAKMAAFVADKTAEIGKSLNPRQIVKAPPLGPYSIVPYQSTHNTGGAVMGADPSTSAVNRYLQSWDVPNVFVMGAAVFPQNAGYNPTGTVGALAYWTAEAIINRYLRDPGPLVHA
ncbi:MAG: GMC family oxidoreductase [Steroidobacteraceae bacterium]|jgi:gluconate 2-dehydrogenase alpha chain